MTRYLEDFHVGELMHFGSYAVSRAEMLEFAKKYDPHPFHVDDAAAAKSLFGTLSASGWHTGAMVMRMIVDYWHEIDARSLGSPGLDQLRWVRPVHAGDRLRVMAEVLDVRSSTSKPDRGSARIRFTAFNQQDEPVMTFEARQLLACRPGST